MICSFPAVCEEAWGEMGNALPLPRGHAILALSLSFNFPSAVTLLKYSMDTQLCNAPFGSFPGFPCANLSSHPFLQDEYNFFFGTRISIPTDVSMRRRPWRQIRYSYFISYGNFWVMAVHHLFPLVLIGKSSWLYFCQFVFNMKSPPPLNSSHKCTIQPALGPHWS